MKQIGIVTIGLSLSLGLLSVSALGQSSESQSSGSSLGDYARQVRKSPANAKPKVFDNDNLPRDTKLSVIGPAAGTTPADASSDAKADDKVQNDPKALTAATKDDKGATAKEWGDKLGSQKDQIDLLTRELDVLQREYQLRAAAMYGDAGARMRNQAEWDKEDAQYKQQIADKQKALDEAKSKLDDMQEDARKAGVPASVREQ